jgi:hypothetical protein
MCNFVLQGLFYDYLILALYLDHNFDEYFTFIFLTLEMLNK